jgi:hypothetical protein
VTTDPARAPVQVVRRRTRYADPKPPGGNYCGICGRPFADGERVFVGTAAGDRKAVAGACCAARLGRTRAFRVHLAAPVTGPAPAAAVVFATGWKRRPRRGAGPQGVPPS